MTYLDRVGCPEAPDEGQESQVVEAESLKAVRKEVIRRRREANPLSERRLRRRSIRGWSPRCAPRGGLPHPSRPFFLLWAAVVGIL